MPRNTSLKQKIISTSPYIPRQRPSLLYRLELLIEHHLYDMNPKQTYFSHQQQINPVEQSRKQVMMLYNLPLPRVQSQAFAIKDSPHLTHEYLVSHPAKCQ